MRLLRCIAKSHRSSAQFNRIETHITTSCDQLQSHITVTAATSIFLPTYAIEQPLRYLHVLCQSSIIDPYVLTSPGRESSSSTQHSSRSFRSLLVEYIFHLPPEACVRRSQLLFRTKKRRWENSPFVVSKKRRKKQKNKKKKKATFI